MLFQDYHLFEFNAGGKRYAVPDPEWDMGRETYAARNVRIGALMDRGITTFNYTDDFGDDWRHSVTVEVVTDADPAVECPRFIDGDRARRRKMSVACPASRNSSTRWQSGDIRNIAKSWTGTEVASSRMILPAIRSMTGCQTRAPPTPRKSCLRKRPAQPPLTGTRPIRGLRRMLTPCPANEVNRSSRST